MLKLIFRSKLSYIFIIYYIFLLVWWIKIYLSGVKVSDENFLFGLVYSFIALIGGINGLLISRKWGGFRSLMGRSIIFLSSGLLCYWFGQTVWSYYNLVLRVEAPYPSIADIGYFSVIPLYILGMYSFAKVSGAKITLSKISGKLIVFIIPLSMLGISYYVFLQNISLDISNPIRSFLDFGTPIGHALAISIALVAYFLTRGVLGGGMKKRIIFIIFAMLSQNITDNTFLYQYAAGTYYNAGINDLMFATSFTLMAIALLSFKNYD